jgi:cytochrome P450
MFAHPEAEAELRADQSKIPDCVEETLRYDGVPQMIWRAPLRDVEIGGVVVPRGATLGVMLGSANRDQARWGPDADEFDIERDAAGHLGFGSGPHVCLGAHLGRLEMRVAIEELLDRTASITKAGPPLRSPNYMLRGHKSMPVEIKART